RGDVRSALGGFDELLKFAAYIAIEQLELDVLDDAVDGVREARRGGRDDDQERRDEPELQSAESCEAHSLQLVGVGQTVPDAVNGVQQLHRETLVDDCAQSMDMAAQRGFALRRVLAPQRAGDFVAADHAGRRSHQTLQQLETARRELKTPAASV